MFVAIVLACSLQGECRASTPKVVFPTEAACVSTWITHGIPQFEDLIERRVITNYEHKCVEFTEVKPGGEI